MEKCVDFLFDSGKNEEKQSNRQKKREQKVISKIIWHDVYSSFFGLETRHIAKKLKSTFS
jgi:hypothetical protein